MKNILILLAVIFSLTANANDSDYMQSERDKIKKERNSLALGWRDNLGYDLPNPGTYELYNIRKAGDGDIITGSGEKSTLYDSMEGKITLLSFIYSLSILKIFNIHC